MTTAPYFSLRPSLALVLSISLIIHTVNGIQDPSSVDSATKTTRIIFASCNDQRKPNIKIWKSILDFRPSLFAWLGDAVYVDIMTFPKRFLTMSPEQLRGAYMEQKNLPVYQQLVQQVREQGGDVIGVWDDHDYGMNDSGKEFPRKDEVQGVYLDFLDVPHDSPRRSQPGLYSYTLHENVLIILLDVRYFRDRLTHVDGDMLGPAQWSWLEDVLTNVPSVVTVIGSGVQVLPDSRPVEHWGRYPSSRQRLFALLQRTKRSGVLFVSGDVHFGEISCIQQTVVGYPWCELTSSGMTHFLSPIEAKIVAHSNPYGMQAPYYGYNFGVLDVDWKQGWLRISIHSDDGAVQRSHTISFSQLQVDTSINNPSYTAHINPSPPTLLLAIQNNLIRIPFLRDVSPLDFLLMALAFLVVVPLCLLLCILRSFIWRARVRNIVNKRD